MAAAFGLRAALSLGLGRHLAHEVPEAAEGLLQAVDLPQEGGLAGAGRRAGAGAGRLHEEEKRSWKKRRKRRRKSRDFVSQFPEDDLIRREERNHESSGPGNFYKGHDNRDFRSCEGL